jgi:hypothetical protein
LWHRFAFGFSSIPGAWGHPLLGLSPALVVVSVSTPPLTPPLYFFKESSALILSERRRGRLNIHFAKWILPPSHNIYTLWLLQITFDHSSYSKNCDNVKIIVIYLKYILW